LRGANTQGATLEQARENLQEAVRMVLEDAALRAVDHFVGYFFAAAGGQAGGRPRARP
jgi:hypothetical protein